MMRVEVYDYADYKAFLNDWIRSLPHRGRGIRSAIAQALRCQQAYVSQVLNQDAQLSLEQAEALARFIPLAPEETHFFLLLVQSARAATPQLRGYFDLQIRQALERRLVLRERIDVKASLDPGDQAVYYSSWEYSAVHVALTIPGLGSTDALARELKLKPARVEAIVQFLLSVGLAVVSEGQLRAGTARIHLPDDSPMIAKHHANWRIRAMVSADHADPTALHYSSVVTLSRADATALRARLIRWIAEAKTIVRDSEPEELRGLSLDFFSLKG